MLAIGGSSAMKTLAQVKLLHGLIWPWDVTSRCCFAYTTLRDATDVLSSRHAHKTSYAASSSSALMVVSIAARQFSGPAYCRIDSIATDAIDSNIPIAPT